MRYVRSVRRLGVGLVLSLVSVLASAGSLSPVTILSVVPANDGSGSLLVDGRVDAAANVSSLDINNIPVTSFDGKNFDVQLTPASSYTINLYKYDGTSEQVVYGDPAGSIDTAIQVLIGNPFMIDVGNAMGTLLTNIDVNAVLGISPNQCVIDTWFLWGCDFYIDKMAIQGTPQIDLFFSPGTRQALTVNIGINIPAAVMQTRLKRSYWWGYDRTSMYTKDIRVFFQLGVAATKNQSVKLILDDPSDVQMHIGSMSVRSTNLAAYIIPMYKDAITSLINNHLVNVVGPFLNLLPIPAIPITLPIDIDGDGVNDAEFDVKMHAELLDVLGSGEGVAALAGSISSANVAPGREVLGARTIPSVAPGPEALTGTTDIGAAISVNMINQVMTAVYQSGIDQKLAVGLTLADLGSFGSFFNTLGYGPDDQLSISLGFGAAPEIQVNSSGLYPLGLDMGMRNLRLVISAPEKEELLMDINADFLVGTSLGTDANGKLFLDLSNLLAVDNITVNGGRVLEVFQPGPLANLIKFAMPFVILEYEPMINDLLNAARLELDIGQALTDWLNTDFPSVPVAGYVSEAGVNDDESYLEIGLGVDFQ